MLNSYRIGNWSTWSKIITIIMMSSSTKKLTGTQVSYVRIEAGKGRFAVWQVCDYIVTPRTIYHALAMWPRPTRQYTREYTGCHARVLAFFLIWPFQQKSTFTMGIPLILYDSLYICMDRHPVKALKCCMDESIYCTGALNFTINAYTCTVRWWWIPWHHN